MAEKFYGKYCGEDNWKKNAEKIDSLISLFTAINRDKSDIFQINRAYREAAKVFCDLIPVVYEDEEGKKRLKSYDRWQAECDIVRKAIAKKMEKIDMFEKQIYDTVHKGYLEVLEKIKGFERLEFNTVVKNWYRDWIEEVNGAAYTKIDALNKLLYMNKRDITEDLVEEFLWKNKVELKV